MVTLLRAKPRTFNVIHKLILVALCVEKDDEENRVQSIDVCFSKVMN